MTIFIGGIGHAVHSAYAIQEQGITPKSQLDFRAAGRVSFDGLSPQEAHAQAAIIRATVDKLPPMQAAAIKARYEPRNYNKAPAVQVLCDGLPKCIDHAKAQKALVWQQYAPNGLSNYAISKEYELDRRLIGARALMVKQEIASLEIAAYGMLEDLLSGQGLID